MFNLNEEIFDKIVSAENLFRAWDAFRKGKGGKRDVAECGYKIEEVIFCLRRELTAQTYKHGRYTGFYITDPKQRHIHKAAVRDRIVHHAVFSVLNPIFEQTFIYDSYSCRIGKGTHRGIERLARFLRQASKNSTRPCWILKCDIKKFFASVNHEILLSFVGKKITDQRALRLVREIIESFLPGLPIGNLTSQLFANIYLNQLDQFVKRVLRARFYIRYTDDFVMVDRQREKLEQCLKEIDRFLKTELKLELHPKKITFKKYEQGIDFLGYVQFPHHRLLRTRTKRRVLKRVAGGVSEQSLQSYLGVLSHANAHKLSEEIKNIWWLSEKQKTAGNRGVATMKQNIPRND